MANQKNIDKSIRIWNLNGECIHIINKHQNYVSSLLVWNEKLISGGFDGMIYIFEGMIIEMKIIIIEFKFE